MEEEDDTSFDATFRVNDSRIPGGKIISIADGTSRLPNPNNPQYSGEHPRFPIGSPYVQYSQESPGYREGCPPSSRSEIHTSVISTPDSDGDLPIHVAVAKQNYYEVECLIELMRRENGTLDCFNNLRQTPLHLSVIMNNIPITKLLLENGASPKICDRFGNSSLHLAVKGANKTFIGSLLNNIDCEGIINSINYDGFAPLHLAVFQRDVQLIKLLACRNANVDVVDGTSGRTPLFHAVESGFEDVVEILLGLGANVNLPNYGGVTPLVVATDKGNKTITSMLISRGAMITCKDEC